MKHEPILPENRTPEQVEAGGDFFWVGDTMKDRISIPDNFTTEEAVFLHDFLDTLADAVWQQYYREISNYRERPEPGEPSYEDDEAQNQDDIVAR